MNDMEILSCIHTMGKQDNRDSYLEFNEQVTLGPGTYWLYVKVDWDP